MRIPAILISLADGTRLISALEAQETTAQALEPAGINSTTAEAPITPLPSSARVVVELYWDIPDETVVDVAFWISPALSTTLTFLSKFAAYAIDLKTRVGRARL